MLKRISTFTALASTAVLLSTTNAQASTLLLGKKIRGELYWPASSLPSKKAHTAHTNYVVFKPSSHGTHSAVGETPGSLSCVYHLTTYLPGCPIATATEVPNTGSKAIGIVDAFNNPQAENNLAIFSARYNLPACTTSNGCLTITHAGTGIPSFDPGWAVESSLDIEMAHAMAPNAKIILVEAQSASNNDLFAAEDLASTLVSAQGGGEISNSWGENEFADEVNQDNHFQTPGIIYFASAGDDSAPANYPSSSPFLISAGGTSIIRDSNQLAINETAWSSVSTAPNSPGGSGGPSAYEPRHPFQNTVARITGSHRGTPDISFDANPKTGVWMYDGNAGTSICDGWCIIGGTSVSSPALAGIINSANPSRTTSQAELEYIYIQARTSGRKNWRDITEGTNGFPALFGYDFVTGLGSPIGYGGK